MRPDRFLFVVILVCSARTVTADVALNPLFGDHSVIQRDKPVTICGTADPDTPSSLFNGMVAPLGGLRVSGILWYQGEYNTNRHEEYAELFAALISGWRRHFQEAQLPFYWVQLPNYRGRSDDIPDQKWAALREVQTRASSIPATGQAVTIDIGNADDIHPTNKREVGRRLALVAAAHLNGSSEEWSGPILEETLSQGNELRLTFSHATHGLVVRPAASSGFELAGADGMFHPATARVEAGQLVVTSPQVARPKALRYAWRNAPDATLFNAEGLPAGPFRTGP